MTLKCDVKPPLKWCIDSSYEVQNNFRSHKGDMFSMGHGCIGEKSIKQKLNTIISTETDMVVVDDVISTVLWVNHFLNEQDFRTFG